MKYLINQQYDVQEPDSSREYGKGERRDDYAAAWQKTGSVVFIGLRGAGKTALAHMVGKRTGLPVVIPEVVEQAAAALGSGGRIVVLDEELVAHPEVHSLIHGAGKVFYLMADTKILSDRVAERDRTEDREALWRDMSASLARLEPQFYSVLHFILHAAQSPEEMLPDALEKIGY